METVLLFLAKALASGIMGHYLKKSLETIDKQLPEILQKGDPKAAEKYITEKGIGNDVMTLATTALENSVVVPLTLPDRITNEDMVESFRYILNLGFTLSHSWGFDLLLPGSLLGPNTFTLFVQNEEPPVELTRTGVQITLPTGLHACQCRIFPANTQNGADTDERWGQYVAHVKAQRKETTGYLSVDAHFPFIKTSSQWCELGVVTARSVKFASAIMIKDARRTALKLQGDTALLSDWVAGTSLMLRKTDELSDTNLVSEADAKSLQELAEKANSVIKKTKG